MNVLHINQSDVSGGAAIAGYRLHKGLTNQGIHSRLLVGSSKINSPEVSLIPRRTRLERQIARASKRMGLNYVQFVGSFDIPKHQFYQEADILNFHNLHSGTFSYLSLPKLTEHKPAVFTLHDMWSFTGHCAYSYECERWEKGCGNCPHLDSYPAVTRDNTRMEWKLKNRVYRKSNLTIVTLSNWLTKLAKKSILSRFPIEHIPNGIDTQIYRPLGSERCKEILDIPEHKHVLMFCAQSLSNPTKGFDLLVKALKRLPDHLKANSILLTLGEADYSLSDTVGMNVLNLGYVSSDHLKAVAYSAADIFVFPTRADNLPLVLQESMACGTPMVSFNIGGVPDLVRHNITGYLAAPEDDEELCAGITTLLEDPTLRNEMSQRCRDITLKEYCTELQISRYKNLYERCIQSQ